jgi:hypothetical protein
MSNPTWTVVIGRGCRHDSPVDIDSECAIQRSSAALRAGEHGQAGPSPGHPSLGMMDEWRKLGAENNAQWCDLVVASHGGQGVFAQDAWTSPMRTPPLFPDAVTLIPSPHVPELLSRVDSSAGCTIKDSFASLDLTSDGFSVLFDAQWIRSPAQPAKAWEVPSDWTEITDPDGLVLWEEAWCHDDGPRGIFLPGLLTESVVVFGRISDDRVVAGGIVNPSAHVVGISNVFSEAVHGVATWSAVAQCARALFPDLPQIGYERDTALAHAQESGFQTAGTLRVWIADA